ncbi:MAG: hypothetical protein QOH47_2192 [Sphingomonadales bacterium]|nr:hypothetical protein [Sphingomonadales bacterium]
MSRRPVALVAAALLTSGCVTHQLIVRNPNPTDDRPPAISSNGFGFGAVQRRNVAECDTNLIDEVRIRQTLGQALATVLTFGLWMPTRIEYRCAKVPSTTGTIGGGGGGSGDAGG